MKAAPNSYGGLNADTAYDSIPNTSYIDAVDVRITTTDGAHLILFLGQLQELQRLLALLQLEIESLFL